MVNRPRPARSGTTEEPAASMRVVVRVRPPNQKESDSRLREVVQVVDTKLLVFDPRVEEEPFFYQGQAQPTYLKRANKEMQLMFDRVFDRTSVNAQVFEGSTKDLVSALLEGYNCSVFVYGATGAGKTHTMVGNRSEPGITYLTMQRLFVEIENRRALVEFEICVSYLEIYNENVLDLLQPSVPLQLREDRKYGVQVAGLSSKAISTAQELLDMLDKGNKNRTQHPTDANAESSRSHAVFQVYVKMRTKATNQTKIVKLSMIDLAGSERASATGCVGERFKEGANINRSLLSLGNCINQLADGSKFIPYRDSKLTRLLKDSLGGNCRTVMIANISPTTASYEDTYNTLKYATRANKIQQRVKKNIINCDGHVAQYIRQAEELAQKVARLEAELAQAKENPFNPKITAENESKKEALLARLRKAGDIYISNLRLVLMKQHKQKYLFAKASRKRKAAVSLAPLCSEAEDEQLADSYRRDVIRLENSSNTLFRQSQSLQKDLQQSMHTLCSTKKDFDTISSEIVSENNSLKPYVEELRCKHREVMAEAKLTHTQSIADLLQDEVDMLHKFQKNALKTIITYFLRLKGQGLCTSIMRDEFQDLIRQAKLSKAITWENNDAEVCEKPIFKFIFDLNPEMLSDVPRISTDKIVVSPRVIRTMIVDAHENVESNDETEDDKENLNTTYTENEPKSISPESIDMDDRVNNLKRPAQQIDPNTLNSTFVMNNRSEEPPAKKPMKPFKFKKVLYERTNILDDKVPVLKVTPVINKVTPFKKPTVYKDMKSGFGSTADRFHYSTQTNSNVQGFKSVRTKERSALSSNSTPYNRPASARR